MTYTPEFDIEAMAEAIYMQSSFRATGSWGQHNLGYGVEDSFRVMAKAALAASPVHAELARVKAECERLRDALLQVWPRYMELFILTGLGNVSDSVISEQVEQALQQKGGE